MLHPPVISWRVEDLAREAEISIGHASNVRRALIDQEWARAGEHGLRLTQPRELLEVWGEMYKRRRPLRETYYTLHHGEALERALQLVSAKRRGGARCDLVLSSFSAAERLAPFTRVQALYAYVSVNGFKALSSHLELAPAPRGANVLLEPIRDPGVCHGVSPIDDHGGVLHTSAIQTYLDLLREGERGEEAAVHLLTTRIVPEWEQS